MTAHDDHASRNAGMPSLPAYRPAGPIAASDPPAPPIAHPEASSEFCAWCKLPIAEPDRDGLEPDCHALCADQRAYDRHVSEQEARWDDLRAGFE